MDLVTPWTVGHQTSLSMEFSRQEYWSRLPFPTLGNLLDPGIESEFPALAGRFFTTASPGSSIIPHYYHFFFVVRTLMT